MAWRGAEATLERGPLCWEGDSEVGLGLALSALS